MGPHSSQYPRVGNNSNAINKLIHKQDAEESYSGFKRGEGAGSVTAKDLGSIPIDAKREKEGQIKF